MQVIYRSYGPENRKSRPSYYGKDLALLSLLRAAENAPGVDLVFLNDGPIPEPRRRWMAAAGTLVPLTDAGMRGSYLAALRLAVGSGRPDSEVVWFSEDDYLYRPDSLRALDEVAARGVADYFALYAPSPGRLVSDPAVDPLAGWTPQGWEQPPPLSAGGSDWVRAVSTTSSFGARRRALREDLRIFRQGMIPYRNSLRDHDTCVVLQGYRPHAWSELADDLLLRESAPLGHRLKQAALTPFKAAMNARSFRRPSRRRTMLTPAPNLATHMEDGWISPGVDWAAEAEQTWDWATTRGLLDGAVR